MDISTIRKKYPQYADMSDKQLVDGLHTKYYSDIPIEQFYSMVGLTETKQPENNSAKTAYISQQKPINEPALSSQEEVNPIIHQAQRVTQFDPNKALFDTSLGIVFGFIIFFILTYGLYGKKRDSLAQLGRWWGGTAVLFFLCTGGEKSDEHWSWGWFVGTFIRSLMSFSMGYLIGAVKWYLFTREKQKTNEPPPFSESYNRSSYQNTSQEKSEERTKKEQSYEEKLSCLRNNPTKSKCLAIFDLNEHATPSEIKSAFKKKMSDYHPDKVSGLGDKLKKLAEEETKLLNVAYQTLQKLGYC